MPFPSVSWFLAEDVYKRQAKDGIIHLINSGSAALDGCMACTDKDGKPVMKKHWDVTQDDAKTMMEQGKGPMNHEKRRSEMLDAANPETISLLGKVFDEYLLKDPKLGRPVFGSKVVHI